MDRLKKSLIFWKEFCKDSYNEDKEKTINGYINDLNFYDDIECVPDWLVDEVEAFLFTLNREHL